MLLLMSASFLFASNSKSDQHSQIFYEKEKHTIVNILCATDRKRNTKNSDWEDYYTGERGKLKYGVAEVSIPKIHKFGEMERHNAFLFWQKEKIGEDVLIANLEDINEKKFLSLLKSNLHTTDKKRNPNKSDWLYYHTVEKEFLSFLKTKLYNAREKDILIFIHGFNVTFAFAIRRTAQIFYDLEFKGVPMAYSWPSPGEVTEYMYDEASVQYTVPHLVAFLKTVIDGRDDANIYIIGQGMGARALVNALKEISFIYAGKHVFKNIILATPDIGRDVFKASLLPYIKKTTDKITLYTGLDTIPLKVEKIFFDGERLAGRGDDVFIDEGLDTINAIGIGTLGQSSFDWKVLMAEEVFLQLDTGGHIAKINDIIVTHSGDIISASNDKTIRVWDSATGREKQKILGEIGAGSNGKIFAIALSPNEEYLAVGGFFGNSSKNWGDIRIYHYPTGKLIKVLKSHTNAITDLSYSSDSKYLISGSGDCTSKIWNIPKNFSHKDTISFHTDAVYAVKIIKKEEHYFALTAGFDNQVALYDLKNRKTVKSYKAKYKLQYLAVSPRHIATCGFGKEILIFDYALNLIKTISSETKPSGLSYSPNGEFLIAGCSIASGNTNIYNTSKNYKKTATFKKHNNLTKAVTFLNNSTAVSAGGNNKEIYSWDRKSAKEKLKIEGVGANIWSVGVSGDVIGWGNKFDAKGDWHKKQSSIQKTLNLKTFRVNSKKRTVKNLKRIKTTFKNYSLTHTSGGDYGYSDATLIIKKNQKEIARITRGTTNGSRHNCYGFYKENIISGGMNGHLKIYNLEGEEIASLIGHTEEIWSIALDGDRLVSGSDAQTIRVWDLSQINMKSRERRSIEPLLNLFISKTNDYIAWTNEGYFTASEEGMKYLYFHLNQGANMKAKVIPMKKLYDHFFRPDLIQLKLSGDEEAYQKATQGLDFKSALQNPPPTVRFKQTAKETNKEKITLSFSVQDENGGIGLIRVYQEGKLIQTIGEGKINKQSANMDTLLEQEILDKTVKIKQKTYIASLSKSIEGKLPIAENIAPVQPGTTTNKAGTYTIDLNLIAGNNEISIEAFNKTNTVTSYRETITINADIPKRKPKLYAIVAGVNEFEASNVHNLKYSKNDAKDIKEIVEHQMNKLYEQVKVTYLEGQDLTKANILKAAKEISKKAKLEDTVIFYISTHGRAAGGKLYLVPYNNKNVKNWIDFEQIFKSIQSIKALNQIFVIDTCESGKANDIVSSVYDSRASVLAKSSGVHMLLATTKGTFAFEHSDPTIHNGVFTYKILQAMRNKTTDSNKDKTISILELSKKLKEPTSNADYQYPVIRNVGSDVGLVKVK